MKQIAKTTIEFFQTLKFFNHILKTTRKYVYCKTYNKKTYGAVYDLTLTLKI